MNTGKTLFAQLMEFLPWRTFERIIARYEGNRGVCKRPPEMQVKMSRWLRRRRAILWIRLPGLYHRPPDSFRNGMGASGGTSRLPDCFRSTNSWRAARIGSPARAARNSSASI